MGVAQRIQQKEQTRPQDAVSAFRQHYAALNAQQQQAVAAIEGPVMVLAGPGTGKTQTLAMRVANILQETQMDPYNILLLTFTESGVVAMRERLMAMIGTPAYEVRIHTFHSFCNSIIQSHPEFFAKTREWQPLTDVEQIQLVQEVLDAMPGTSKVKHISDPYLYLRDILSAIKELKAEDISPAEFKKIMGCVAAYLKDTRALLDEFFHLKPAARTESWCERVHVHLRDKAAQHALRPALAAVFEGMFRTYAKARDESDGPRGAQKARTQLKNNLKSWYSKLEHDLPKHVDLQKAYAAYEKALVKRGRYDYEDMILHVIAAWREHDTLLAQYQEQFQYVLVDEYQDTNGAQNEVVELLTSFDSAPNVFVVGDDKQSIFRFQGASLNNMLTFYERYRDSVQVISLRANYRSQQTVLDAAAAVIRHNEESLAKYIPGITIELESHTGRTPQSLELQTFATEEVENYAVVQRVKQLIEGGTAPDDIAVLYRVNKDGGELLRMLRKAGVPARLEAGENVLDSVEVDQWLTLLAYLERGDDAALGRVLLFDWFGLDALDAMKIIQLAGRQRLSIFRTMTSAALLDEAGVRTPSLFLEAAEKLARWKKLQANTTVLEFLHTLLEESGWITWVTTSADRLVVLKKVSAVLAQVKEMNRANPTMTIGDLLRHIQLLGEYSISLAAQPWQVAANAVHLMTAHKAKGLEFEHVFIMRLNDKHWGNNRTPAALRLPHGLVKYDAVVAEDKNEDERRLFYVALTRAKQQVVMTRAKHSASGRETVPSLFVKEIPPQLVTTVEETGDDEELVQGLVVAEIHNGVPGAGQEDVRAWLQDLLRHYVMSVTHLNRYLEDPVAFYERHLLQIPSAPTQSQALGTAVHNALEDLAAQHRQSGQLPDKDWLLERFAHHADRVLLSATQRKNVLDEGAEQLAAYYDHYRGEFSPYVMSEVNFRHHGVHVDDLQLTGKLDRIELLDAADLMPDGTWRRNAAVNVIDYKTGNPDRKYAAMKPGGDYYRQLVFYKLLCDESPQFPYRVASLELNFIQPSATKGFVKKRVAVTDEEVAQLKADIRRVWADIKALKFLDAGAQPSGAA